MNENLNPLEDYIKSIVQNTNFLNRLLTPKISIPLIAIFLTIIGVIVIKG